MKEAVEEAVVHNNGDRNVSAAFDGTWQKRVCTCLNGLVSAVSIGTGKVL